MSDHEIEMSGKRKAAWGRESVCDTEEAAERVGINQGEEITESKKEISKQIYERWKRILNQVSFTERYTNICVR